jgi:hypothetical protein
MDIKGVRIVSDGTMHGTRVYDREGRDITGELGVRKIEWAHGVGEIPIAKLECTLSSLEASIETGSITLYDPETDAVIKDVTALNEAYRRHVVRETAL